MVVIKAKCPAVWSILVIIGVLYMLYCRWHMFDTVLRGYGDRLLQLFRAAPFCTIPFELLELLITA